MTKIYDQFDAATSAVGAYAIFMDADYEGRVVFKYPRDGAGRLWCYLQVWGYEMVRGYASGYGYDKRTAAFEDAASKFHDVTPLTPTMRDFLSAAKANGLRWDQRLKAMGYTVACVID